MKWYTIDDEYLEFIRVYENRIPKTDYGEDKFKPFFGELFKIDDLSYMTQVSHPQNRHSNMKENIDFIKLYDNIKLIAIVNLNYMFPVHKNRIIEVTYKNIDNFRTFKTEQQKNSYITLLKKEMKEIKIKNVQDQAVKLYNFKHDYPNDKISLRCLDYKYLEQKCQQYEYAKNELLEYTLQVATKSENN